MAKQDISKLKGWFETGKYPTQEQFWDWMDSYMHKDEKLGIVANFPELDAVLQQKADKEVFKHHFENDHNPHKVTKQQVGLGSVDNTMDINKPVSVATKSALDLKADKKAVGSHLKDYTNPHKVTKQQIGLGKADNTADLDKPVSRETQTALYLKADRTDLSNHSMNNSNPHQVTKAQVGLGNVDDTADVNKPISTATQTALDLKADKSYIDEQIETNRNITKAGTATLPVLKFEQGALLTTPENGAWEWDGTDLYFTTKDSRQRINREYEFYKGITPNILINSKVDVFGITPTDSDVTPLGLFSSYYSVLKLDLLLEIRLAHQVPSSEFSVKTELFLNIKNGVFCTSSKDTEPCTSLKIVEISGNKNVGLKEINLSIASLPDGLTLFGINNIDGIKSEFSIPQLVLKDKYAGALEAKKAIFSFVTKASITTTIPKARLASNVNYYTMIRSLTLTKIR